MSGNVTVSVRSILVAALVAAALLVAYLLGGGGGGSPARAADDPVQASGERRLITMSGTGDATAVPDRLSFAVAVHLTRPDLDTALAAANHTMKRVLGALQEYDVARSDVQTTGLSMDPVYDYHEYSPPTIRGYRVSERAAVLVQDLARGGEAVGAVVAAGGNDVRVSDIRLRVGDTDAVPARARDAAVDAATAKAEQYAEAAGQELGDVVTLRELHARPLVSPQATYDSARVAGKALSEVPIRAGRDRTSVTVQVVWALE
jgi:uncharacterized protein YggE